MMSTSNGTMTDKRGDAVDATTITALAGGIAVVLRAVTELVKVLRARRSARATDEPEPEPVPV
jgi:hypothetical protein